MPADKADKLVQLVLLLLIAGFLVLGLLVLALRVLLVLRILRAAVLVVLILLVLGVIPLLVLVLIVLIAAHNNDFLSCNDDEAEALHKALIFWAVWTSSKRYCRQVGRDYAQGAGKFNFDGGRQMSYYKKMMGKNIYLAPIDPRETDSFIKWMNDRAVAEPFGEYGNTISSKDDLKWIYEPPAHMQRYAIVLTEDDELIGSISIHNIDHLNRNAFLGIFIGDEKHRGRGYGREAIGLVLEYGFKTLNLHNIMLSVHADNHAGIACYKKAGFREDGRLREWEYEDGRYVDKLYMSIMEHEFLN